MCVRVIFLFVIGLLLFFEAIGQYPLELLTTPEKTAFERTSNSEEVLEFIRAIEQQSPYAHVDTIAVSDSGQVIPMVILARPRVTTPAEARASGKTLVYVQGNIHGGEVEGKEALLVLLREILLGKEQALLDRQILLFTPNYNPDGNNNLSPKHRSSQEHCPHLAGGRRSGGDWASIEMVPNWMPAKHGVYLPMRLFLGILMSLLICIRPMVFGMPMN